MIAVLAHLALFGALQANDAPDDVPTREATHEERLDGEPRGPLPVPPAPPQGDPDEDRVDENTPPPPEVRWPPKASERMEEEEPDLTGPSAVELLQADHTLARSSVMGGDLLVAITFAVGFALAVDGDTSTKLAAAGGALAGLAGPGVLLALAFDRSIATAWFDWFGWLGGALTPLVFMVTGNFNAVDVLSAMAVGGLLGHLGLALTPDHEGVHGLEFLLLGAGLTLATVLFIATASGLGHSDFFADALPRAAMLLPGLIIAATRVGFAARNDWGSPPVVEKISLWAAPRTGGLTAGVGFVF